MSCDILTIDYTDSQTRLSGKLWHYKKFTSSVCCFCCLFL